MKSHMLLLHEVLMEMGTWCHTSTTHDWKTIVRRSEHEGISFVTISLPIFAKDLQRALEQGKVDSTCFVGFAKHGQLPRFLGGFVSRVFTREDGCLVDDPDVDAIHAIRQICLLYSKVLLPCSNAREKSAFKQFIDCETQVRESDRSMSDIDLRSFKEMSFSLLVNVFLGVDSDIYYEKIVPKHGPGSTADKLIGNDKFSQRSWTERLDKIFPFQDFIFPSWNPLVDSPDVHLREPGSELPVRVISVPKTLKTPRIIGVEPTCMQYVQQGILESLVGRIERDDILSKFLGFSQQEPNQVLAKRGSSDGSLATLDLSEASDRVSNQLVRAMLFPFPHLFEGVDATRSRKADVPGYPITRIAKFASMGSALCFPIEAMVFLTVVFLGIQKELRRPLTGKDVKSLFGRVRIYGDDIIVPVDYVEAVVRELQTFGFAVNTDKSFWTGKFRESCGKEYYAGNDVSIVKVREMLPTQRQHVRGIVSTVSLRNQFYEHGMWRTARWLDERLERLIPFPVVLPTSPALGRHSFLGYSTEKMCPKLHKPLVRAFVVTSLPPKSNLEGRDALLKFFLKRGEQPFADRKHLERAGRPKRVDIKLRWVSAV